MSGEENLQAHWLSVLLDALGEGHAHYAFRAEDGSWQVARFPDGGNAAASQPLPYRPHLTDVFGDAVLACIERHHALPALLAERKGGAQWVSGMGDAFKHLGNEDATPRQVQSAYGVLVRSLERHIHESGSVACANGEAAVRWLADIITREHPGVAGLALDRLDDGLAPDVRETLKQAETRFEARRQRGEFSEGRVARAKAQLHGAACELTERLFHRHRDTEHPPKSERS